MEQIDVVFYINLERRQDRKEHFLQEIPKLCTDLSKLIRIDAIPMEEGLLGCVLSHIKALEAFEANPNWNTCLVFEDDFTFRSEDVSANNAMIATCFQNFPTWDMFLLAYNQKDFAGTDSPLPPYKKVLEAQTTSGYCVTRAFLPTLLQNFRESAGIMARDGYHHTNAIDQYWKRIQPNANWYTTTPSMGYQYANYSDNAKAFHDYGC
jgi:GR25 family glycosyltransferase involved in LPS biosynthesis